MPLRDHFHPPVSKQATWEGFHSMWPGAIVHHLRTHLPSGYVAEPRVHLGAFAEIDVKAYERDSPPAHDSDADQTGGVATAALPATFPVVTVETAPLDEYEYAVHIYDAEQERTLVAAIEIVSPGNKDRPRKRNAFVGKCAALLRAGVSVSVIDLVTVRRFNLFAELMAFVGHEELIGGVGASLAYVASCRWGERGEEEKTLLDVFSQPLVIGQRLPVIPVWLSEKLLLPLDLEPSYEQACHDVWITGA